MLTPSWPFYFASIMSIQYHPGANTRGHERLTLEEAAEIADEMCRIESERVEKCQQHG